MYEREEVRRIWCESFLCLAPAGKQRVAVAYSYAKLIIKLDAGHTRGAWGQTSMYHFTNEGTEPQRSEGTSERLNNKEQW